MNYQRVCITGKCTAMSSFRRVSCVLLAILMIVPMPGVMSSWIPVVMAPSGMVTFPEGGGERALNLTVPADGLVKGTLLNVTGMPAYINHSWSGTDENLWARSEEKSNLTISPDGIGLGGFGSWWEDAVTEFGFVEGSNNTTLFSPILNVSAYSRIMVQGDFPNGTNYTVDVLDPMASNSTIRKGMRNGEMLDLTMWMGREIPYRELVLRLDVNRSDVNLTPILYEWGVGTDWRAGTDTGNWSNGGDLTTDENRIGLDRQIQWTQMFPAFSPTARIGHRMVYSPADKEILMWAGQTSYWVFPTEMYSYSSVNNVWSDKNPLNLPPGRWVQTMAYDVKRDKIYMFAGLFETAARCRDDTWEYDPILNTWNQLAPAISPSGRWAHSMAYVSGYDVVVMFGGYEKTTSKLLQDTWLFYPATKQWVQAHPPASPPARAASSMVYDEKDNVIILFGGYNATTYFNDIWIYEVGRDIWTRRHPVNSPPGRTDACMIYDGAFDVVTMFSGTDQYGNVLNDTWIYNYTTNKWRQMIAPSSPPARGLADMAYDPNLGQSVLYGGNLAAGVYFSDTWILRMRYKPISWLLTPDLLPFYHTYGNLFVNATTPPGTGYWGNVTDENGNTLLSHLKNGDPIPVNVSEYPRIRLNLTLWTNDANETPIIHEWGYGFSLNEGDIAGALESSRELPVCPESIIPSWLETVPSNTSVSVKIRLSPDNQTWSDWLNVTSNQTYSSSNCTKWGQYLQYNITLNNSDANVTPVLYGFRIEYHPYLSNAILASGEIITAPEGIIIASRPVMNCSLPPGALLYLSLSADNGTTWQKFDNGVWTDLELWGTSLRWKADFIGDGNGTPLLNSLMIDYTTEHFSSDISIDVGVDGKDEWNYAGQLTGTVPASNLTTALNAYVDTHRAEVVGGYIIVLVNIRSRTGGIVNLGDAAVDFVFSPHVLSHSPIGMYVPLNAPIEISFSGRMKVGSLDMSVTPSIAPGYSWSLDQRNLTMTHPDFQENTTYYVTINAGALSMEGAPMLDDFSWNFTTTSIDPLVTDHSPSGVDVSLDASIMVSFNEQMRENSLDIVISPAVSLDPSWSMDHRELTLTHSLFQQYTTYTVTVKAGALSIYWAAMLEDYSWNFTTTNIDPLVIHHGPTGVDVPLDASIMVSFTEQMRENSMDIVISPPISFDSAWSMDDRELTLTHPLFQENTTYTVTVKAGALSIYWASMLEDYSWTFTTTSINPIVLLHTTIGVDVPLDAPIVISFSKMMNGNSVKILLDPYLTLNHSWSQDLTELTLTHPNFQENTTYTVTVKAGALSIFGAPILADYSWSFTTISIPIDAPRDEIPDPDGVPVVAVASIAVIVGIGLVASTEFGMYWFLVLILPLYVRMRKEGVFDNKTRFALHGIIIENPGIHYHALTKELEIPNGSAIYHLSVLEREGYIKTRRDGMRKRFYSDTAKVPEDHKLPPEHLRLQIVMLVSEKPGLTQKAISEEMGITRDVIGYHLRELVKEGYLADSRDGKYTVYHPKRRMMDAK